MTITIDRRSLIAHRHAGAGRVRDPRLRAGAVARRARLHPQSSRAASRRSDSMLLWTRYVPANGGAVRIDASNCPKPPISRKIVAGGGGDHRPVARSHRRRSPSTGCSPGARYHYRFVAPDGIVFPGRADQDAARRRRAAHGARRSSPARTWASAGSTPMPMPPRATISTCAVHLGDYFYEYAPGTYPVRRRMRSPGASPQPDGRDRSSSPITACATPAIAPIPICRRCTRAHADDRRSGTITKARTTAGRAAPQNHDPQDRRRLERRAGPRRSRRIANGCRSPTNRGRRMTSAGWPRCSAPKRGCRRAPNSPMSRRCSRPTIRRGAQGVPRRRVAAIPARR